MWKHKTVERALFLWQKWLQSIIVQWMNPQDDIKKLVLDQLKVKARQELQKLGFPVCLWLELYWICCIASDYHLEHQSSFENIVVPPWLPLPFDPALSWYRIESGTRIYPPDILDEGDIKFIEQHYGVRLLGGDNFFEQEPRIFLPSRHEFYQTLNKLKGRPRISGKPGRPPHYSDRLAVCCATLKDQRSMSYVEIADEFGLSSVRYYQTFQSDTARHLVRRGRKLISSSKNWV